MDEQINPGWICLSRLIQKSEIWRKPSDYLKIFIYILLNVNHKDGLFPRGSNFFNFSEERPHGVTLNQIYKFLAWAKSEKVGILATQKSTRGVVIKVNNYDKYQTIDNYYRQDSRQDSGRTAAGQQQDSGRTINKNEKMKECKNTNTSDFLNFYSLYPRKESKKAAEKAYDKALKDGATPQMLLDGVKRYQAYITNNGIKRNYIKMPSTWLNQGCWEDEFQKTSESANTTSKYAKVIKRWNDE